MFLLGKKWQKIKWVILTIIGLYIIGTLYSLFFDKTNVQVLPVLVMGLLLGAALMFFMIRATRISSSKIITESSHTIIESIKKVVKVVCAEGHFNEMYDYEETKKILSFIPSTKKALVIIKAKVLIGFDFEKCIWETDEENRKINLVTFPEPEILSIEPDYNYYNMENGLFNKFSKEDFMHINHRGKKQIEQAALKSELPKIASGQMRALLTEMLDAKNWNLENGHKIGLLENK